MDNNKLWKTLQEREYQTTLPASCVICMQVKKQQLESDMKQQTVSKSVKEYVKAMVFPVVMYGVRVGLCRKLSAEELMLLNCGVGEDS